MDKASLKKVIKPLIKECLQEIMVEEGLIRMVKEHVIKENVQVKSAPPETKTIIKSLQKESVDKKKQAIQEMKKAATFAGFDPFAGTEDIDSVEVKGQEGVKIDNLFDENMLKSWSQQLELLEGKR
jgi:hypothetical protein